MKKLTVLFLTFLLTIGLFAGCGSQEGELPESVKNAKGHEKWQTPVDYSDANNWLSAEDAGKDVDLVYFYPTTFNIVEVSEDDVADIDDAGMRRLANEELNRQATAFEEECNIYAPFYRQISAPYALTLDDRGVNDLLRYSASKDPSAALDYYFEHFNNGKPFILAGHSQGSQILTKILSDYMADHPEHYKNMVAAYVIGYSVTESYLEENPHLKFAEGADDTGVIISWNTEGPGNIGQHNAVVTEGAISINPLNWKRDDTYAAVSENAGSLDENDAPVEGYADAQIDPERGVVICRSADPSVYAIQGDGTALFGPESYHSRDYSFYYENIKQNAADRIAAFFK